MSRLKSLLLFLALLTVWAWPASAGVLYEQNFESVSDAADTGWTYGGESMSIESDASGKYIRFSLGNNNGRSAQLTWGQEIFFKDGDSVLSNGCYRISYDFSIVQGSNNHYYSDFTVFTNHEPVINQPYRTPWAPEGYWQNYLFDMSQVTDESYGFAIDGGTIETVEEDGTVSYSIDYSDYDILEPGKWYTVTLEVNVNTRTVSYSVVSLEGEVLQSGIRMVPERNVNGEAISMYAEGLFIMMARYQTIYLIDNIKIEIDDDRPLVAGDNFEYEGIWYTVLDADAKTCKTKDGSYDPETDSYTPGNNCEGEVTIPAIVSDGTNGYKVVGIGYYSFCYCSRLITINIPDGVTLIGGFAFWGCSSLTSINIPEGVTSIQEATFSGCSSLTTINIPDGLNSIRDCAFYGCSRLTTINIPDGVTSIGNYAFCDCTSLTTINIPDGLNSIGDCAFYGCSSLTTINIPDGMTSISWATFYGCSSLTTINISDGVTIIGNEAFRDCIGLTTINLPDGVTSIEGRAFRGCSSLTTINIPDGVTSIQDATFSGCSSLTTINIPDGVTSIGNYAFSGCSSLTTINIPDGVSPIGVAAFESCSSLKEVSYAAYKPVWVDENMFSDETYRQATLYMPNATLADIQATVPWNKFAHIRASDGSVGFEEAGTDFEYEGVFYTVLDPAVATCKTKDAGNVVAGNIRIPDIVYVGNNGFRVVEIGKESFAGSSQMRFLSLPSTVESVGESAFDGCERLTSLIWRGNSAMPDDVSNAFDNPNLLIYVDSIQFAPRNRDHNVVAEGVCERLVLTPGYAFTPYADFTANYSIMTKEFTQQTSYDGCSGWETIVVPFDVARVSSPQGNVLLPFSVVSDVNRQRPYWLYEADPEGEWKASDGIRAGVSYLIAMPNNPRYNPAYNISGPVTFSNATPQEISTGVTAPYAETWTSGREFRPLWLPLTDSEAADAMGLNVNMTDLRDEYGTYLAPGSAFCADVLPKPLEAYVTRIDGRRAIPVHGGQTFVGMLNAEDGLRIVADQGAIILSSDSDRTVDVMTMEGIVIRRANLKAGETYRIDNLTRGFYIVAGRKITVK